MSDIKHVFNSFQNKDDVLFRAIIVGTLHAFRDKIYWYNTINSESTKVDLPFYFTISGSERFLSDIFLNEFKLENGQATESVYEKLPRAIVSLENLSIQEEYLTNKFTRAEYLKKTEDGEVKQYSAEFNSIPLKLDMRVEIYLDSIIDIFKCIQAVLENIYKNVYYYVDIFSIKVPCYFFIPETLDNQRPVNFSFTDKKEIKVTFNIEVQADYPIFKKDTEFFAGNNMQSIKYTINPISTSKTAERDGVIALDSRGIQFTVTQSIWPSGNNTSNFYPNE